MLGMKNDLAACIKKPEVELIELLRDGDRHAKVANGQRDQAVNDNVLVRASDEMRDMGHAGKSRRAADFHDLRPGALFQRIAFDLDEKGSRFVQPRVKIEYLEIAHTGRI